MVIFYEETQTFLQIKQQGLILSLMVTNCEDEKKSSKSSEAIMSVLII